MKKVKRLQETEKYYHDGGYRIEEKDDSLSIEIFFDLDKDANIKTQDILAWANNEEDMRVMNISLKKGETKTCKARQHALDAYLECVKCEKEKGNEGGRD